MQHVIERLQPVLLAARGDAGPASAGAYHLGELGQYITVLIEDTGGFHHVHDRADGAARHREANHTGVCRGGDWVEFVFAQALVQDGLNLVHLVRIDIETVTGSLESVRHGADVRLRGAGGQRAHGQIDAVHATRDAGHVTGHGGGGGVVRVLHQWNLRREDCLDALGCLVAGMRVSCAGGILEANRVKVNVALEQFADDVDVKLRRVRFVGLERQAHERDANLMVHAGVDNRLAGFDQIVDVVHEVEVAVDCGPVLVHQLGLQR